MKVHYNVDTPGSENNTGRPFRDIGEEILVSMTIYIQIVFLIVESGYCLPQHFQSLSLLVC